MLGPIISAVPTWKVGVLEGDALIVAVGLEEDEMVLEGVS